MTHTKLAFNGSIPERYDRYLGPVLFAPFGEDLARRVGERVCQGTVLELACGTGIVTRQLREALAPPVRLVATDLSEAMVAYAQSRVPAAGIEWQPADAMLLPFEDGSAAAVVCQFGLMFVPDKPRALREIRRVLQPEGRVWLSVWDSLAANPAACAAHAAVSRVMQSDPPSFFHVPHGLHDTDALLQLFEEGGFSNVEILPVTLDAVSESAQSLATGFVTGTPLSALIAEGGGDHARLVEEVAEGLRAIGGDRPFRSISRAWLVTARRDAER